MLNEASEPSVRGPSCWRRYVEIMLAAGDLGAARAAADELAQIAAGLGAPDAVAPCRDQATGAVLLAEGEAACRAASCCATRWSSWRDLDAPYEVARVRLLLGLAYRKLGDEASAEIEFGAARKVFEQLGAAPDLARVEAPGPRRRTAGRRWG